MTETKARFTPERLNELEQIAKAATPGRWAAMPRFPLYVVPAADADRPVGGSVDPNGDARYARVIAKVQQDTPDYEGWERFTRRRFSPLQNQADAEHIAAFNPATVLALLSEVRAIRESVARLEQENVELRAERRHLLAIQAGQEMSAEGEAHWRNMCAEDDPRVFGFTNREMRRMFVELDAARQRTQTAEDRARVLTEALRDVCEHARPAFAHSPFRRALDAAKAALASPSSTAKEPTI